MHIAVCLLIFACAANALPEVVVAMTKDMFVDKSFSYNPPPFVEKAKRARYLLHYTNWSVIGTTSSLYKISGVPVPFTNVVAISDGPMDNSTGIPYFYVSLVDPSVKDIAKNDVVCISMSEMETSYCESKHFDPELPPCARLTLCGQFKHVSGDEKTFALNAMFSRFPDMKDWPSSHDFFPAKLDLSLIWILDYFGGATLVSATDYFKADPLK